MDNILINICLFYNKNGKMAMIGGNCVKKQALCFYLGDANL